MRGTWGPSRTPGRVVRAEAAARPHSGLSPAVPRLATSGPRPAVGYEALPPASLERFPLWIQTSCLRPHRLKVTGSFQKVKGRLAFVSWQVRNIRKVLRKIDKPFGLYPNFLSPVSGNWMQREYRDATTRPPPPPPHTHTPPSTDCRQHPVQGTWAE